MKLNELKARPLTEGMAASVKSLDLKKFTLADVLAAVQNSGYEDDENGTYMQCVYGKFVEKTKSHIFYLLFDDENSSDADKSFAISEVYISLDKHGKIAGEYGGSPVAEDMTKDEAVKKLASLKGK